MKPILVPAMSKAIPLIWAAFNAQELQAQVQKGPGGGMYSGPCAIGVTMKPEERLELDGIDSYMGIAGAVDGNYVILENPDELDDYMNLQDKHDEWLSENDLNSLNDFVLELNHLSEKYPPT